MRRIEESELIINEDGTVFHLHLRPEQLAEKIVLVGDPSRVDVVASFFDEIECEVSSREFHAVTGCYKGKRLTVLSHGIGTDNIDIVITELDALANIDFSTRQVKEEFKPLTMVRIGTSGGLQMSVPVGTFCVAEKSIGFDTVLYYYKGSESIMDEPFGKAFSQAMDWSLLKGRPYVVDADATLVDRIAEDDMKRGITISAVGFYGPQGRELRLSLADDRMNDKITAFRYEGREITNYEMESSVLAGMAKLMGHRAMTVCLIIANRVAHSANSGYKNTIGDLIVKVLDRI